MHKIASTICTRLPQSQGQGTPRPGSVMRVGQARHSMYVNSQRESAGPWPCVYGSFMLQVTHVEPQRQGQSAPRAGSKIKLIIWNVMAQHAWLGVCVNTYHESEGPWPCLRGSLMLLQSNTDSEARPGVPKSWACAESGTRVAMHSSKQLPACMSAATMSLRGLGLLLKLLNADTHMQPTVEARPGCFRGLGV